MADAFASQELPRLVRDGDYARFLAIQVAPREIRPALYAITAFVLELYRIPTVTSEPLMAMMRSTWWREQLEAIAAGSAPRQHPLLEAIAALYALSPAAFQQCLRMLARLQEGLEDDDTATARAEMEPMLDAAWNQVPNTAKALSVLGWLRLQPTHRLRRPSVILRVLWKGFAN